MLITRRNFVFLYYCRLRAQLLHEAGLVPAEALTLTLKIIGL